MSFSCPHLDMAKGTCDRLRTDCIPGRPGCTLPKTCRFAVPWQERLRRREAEKLGLPPDEERPAAGDEGAGGG